MMYLGLGALLTIVGLIFEMMAFTEPDWTLASRIFAVVCGLIFLAVPAMVTYFFISEWLHRKNRTSKNPRQPSSALEHSIREIIDERTTPKSEGTKEVLESSREQFLTRFRAEYTKFFEKSGLTPNSPLQFDTTQIYWHILSLQKKRLDTRKITMAFASQQKTYDSIPAVSGTSYFDGKYQVSEVNETVTICQTFLRDGRILLKKELERVAHYVTTSAKKTDRQRIVCPNCGAETTRENLIDGCDYCGTKFTVEDLDNKVSAFRLRDNYEIQYEIYKKARAKYNQNVFWKQFVIYFVLVCLIYLSDFSGMIEITGNAALAVLFIPLTSAFAAGMFAYLGLMFFWVCIFPIKQARESIRFYSKKRLDRMRKRYAQDTKAEKDIRRFDPLFSVAAFYSGLNNKLACVHFADTAAACSAFFENDRDDLQSHYHDVIDMDVEDINVADFCVKDGLQQIQIQVTLNNLADRGSKLQKQKENLALTLIKAADCKTQTVCGPSVLHCHGCGASIALEQGKVCAYCGEVFDLKRFDWVIRGYEIL